MSAIGEGKFWDAFKKTDWYLNVCDFVEQSVKERKDELVRLAGMGESLKAARVAGEINGLTALKDYIDGKILEMKLDIQEENEQKEFARSIPSHI